MRSGVGSRTERTCMCTHTRLRKLQRQQEGTHVSSSSYDTHVSSSCISCRGIRKVHTIFSSKVLSILSLYSQYTKALTFENFPQGHQVLHPYGPCTHELVLTLRAKGQRGTDCQGADTPRTLGVCVCVCVCVNVCVCVCVCVCA
jgi:hypothetical protein